MAYTIFVIFVVGLLLNLAWEFAHWRFYTTCLDMQKRKRSKLLVIMSIKDALWIVAFYVLAVSVLRVAPVLGELISELLLVFLFGVVFSFIDERVSLRMKRWEYAPSMPTVFGVGLSPLLEVGVTGALAVFVAGLV